MTDKISPEEIRIPCGHGFQTLKNRHGAPLNITGIFTSPLPPAVNNEIQEVRRAFDSCPTWIPHCRRRWNSSADPQGSP